MKYLKIVLILLAAFALHYVPFSGDTSESVVAKTDLTSEAAADAF
jgi:hypothetical protein